MSEKSPVRINDGRSTTFDHALRALLQAADGAWARLRAMTADPDHLDRTAGDWREAAASLKDTVDAAYSLKATWERTARNADAGRNRP